MKHNEKRLRRRRAEILMAGDGSTGMERHEAEQLANEESIRMILDQDGDHIRDTDPDLFDDKGQFLDQ